MKKFFIIGFVILSCLGFQSNLYAITCPYCGSSSVSEEKFPYRCNNCEKIFYSSSFPRPRPNIHSIPSSKKTENEIFKDVLKESGKVKGKGKAILGIVLIIGGVFAFLFCNPWIGIPLGLLLIIVGLHYCYNFFKLNSAEKPRLRPSLKIHGSAPEDGNATSETAVSHFVSTAPNNSPAMSSPTPHISKKKSPTNGVRPSRVSAQENTGTKTQPSSIIETQKTQSAESSTLIIPPNANTQGEYWYQEGMLYCNGNDGREIDYKKAAECFEKSKNHGYSAAAEALKALNGII